MHNASSTAYIILATSETAGDLQDHTSCIIAFDDNDFQLVTVTTPTVHRKETGGDCWSGTFYRREAPNDIN